MIIAKGAIFKVAELLEYYKYPLVITDIQIYNKYKRLLENSMNQNQSWLKISENRHGNLLKNKGFDVILGFGGGRSIDVAKLIAKQQDLDWISIPTAASHDGIASNIASVNHNGYKYSIECKSPIGIIADLSIIGEAPPRLRIAGIGDILGKISSLSEWTLAYEKYGEPFNEKVYLLAKSALDSVLKDDSLFTLINAEINLGRAMTIFGNSRPCSGTEHSISHIMESKCHNLHGYQVAFSTLLCLYYLYEVHYTNFKIENLYKFMVEKHLPTKLSDMNISDIQFLNFIHSAIILMRYRKRHSIFEYLNLKNSDILKTIKNTYQI